VNGDLAWCDRRRVKPAKGVLREGKSRVGLTGKDGRGPAQGLGWRESAIQRFTHRQKRCADRGTGAVMATGSYEGSLPIEGILDHREASAFTRRRGWWSWRSPHPPTRTTKPKVESYGYMQHTRKRVRREDEPEEVATGVSEARSHQRRGKTTPTLLHPVARQTERENMRSMRSAEAVFGRRETSGPPVMPCGA